MGAYRRMSFSGRGNRGRRSKKPPETVPIPGAKPLSPKDEALRQAGHSIIRSVDERDVRKAYEHIIGNRPAPDGSASEKRPCLKGQYREVGERQFHTSYGLSLCSVFGLEFVTALVHADWLDTIVSFVGLVGLMAAALHWTQLKTWTTRLNPNWIVATFSLLLLAIILAPFVEQRRWPFSTVFHDPPTAEDIAKATAPI